MANANTWRWFIGFLSARREGAFIPLLAVLCAVCLTAVSCGSPFSAAAITDGSEWRIIDGKQVKVKGWDHDAAGNRIPIFDKSDDATPEKPADKQTPRERAAEGIYETGAYIGKLTFLLILASIASLVASYWLPWLPKGAAWKGFAVAGGLIVARYWLVAYGVLVGEVSFWATIAAAVGAAVFVGWPWVVGLKNRSLIKAGEALAAKGDAQAGTALIIEGSPDDFKKPGQKSLLKQAVALEALGKGTGGAA